MIGGEGTSCMERPVDGIQHAMCGKAEDSLVVVENRAGLEL